LSGPVRLMVIGYSFADDHINDAIYAAASGSELEIFIIDPAGIGVIDKNAQAPIYTTGRLIDEIGPYIRGASRRSLREVFGSDRVEHAKVASFIQ
jgi:hypothetical protein